MNPVVQHTWLSFGLFKFQWMQFNYHLCTVYLLNSLVALLTRKTRQTTTKDMKQWQKWRKREQINRKLWERRQTLSLKSVTMETVPFFPLLLSIWSCTFLCNSGYKLEPPPCVLPYSPGAITLNVFSKRSIHCCIKFTVVLEAFPSYFLSLWETKLRFLDEIENQLGGAYLT